MNTKILLAMAATVALSACGHRKKPAPITSEWEFPLVEPARAAAQVPTSPASPAGPRNANRLGLRVPDVTQRLPNLGNQPSGAPALGPSPAAPLSEPAPAPEPAPTPGPAIIPAPEVTPGPEITPVPEVEDAPVEAPSE